MMCDILNFIIYGRVLEKKYVKKLEAISLNEWDGRFFLNEQK